MPVVSLPKKSHGVIHSEKQLANTLDYIVDPKKTNNYELVSGQNISVPQQSLEEMLLTRELAILIGNQPRKNERFGFHFVQSFSPEDQLTPEQIHEIGKKTMNKYLGDSAEFVIATHTDKNHIHNHIVLNATNPKTLKKFQQSQMQFEELKEISDQISLEYGAKIIDRTLKNSHKKYQQYLAQNSYRNEIKTKLKFLMTHANTWEDFKEKALTLNLKVDDTKKYVTYQLIDSNQERQIRDRSLKNQSLLKENLIARLKRNSVIYSKEEVVTLWNQQQKIKNESQEKEVEILVEDWQVQKETDKFLYVTIDYGLEREAAIKIPARCVDKLEDGNYQLFIKKQDRFYFVDEKNPSKNKMMLGKTVVKNLENQSGNVPLYANSARIKLRQILTEFDFLISKGLGFDKSFEVIGLELENTLLETEDILEQLDKKIVEYVERNKTYARTNTQIVKKIENLQKERSELQKTLQKVEKDIQFYNKSVQRYEEYEQERSKRMPKPRLS
ncbi:MULTISPECIES: relaxase/mobilization nuclease domain-containing protein [Enterococcus]|uniref:relaxase/mobilization nuclease domain-containing protein n=1 Tax=Enterococcus TaxID=1350 RepID=UPI00116423E9|nr:relaxase/mobilization nuclease domain-containing protein [Enterococcus avium]HAP3020834.1 relaxase/mobilization nuclease domain-containing protein [Enterococcus faecalis]AYQ24263.1 primosome assembly protein PriA [Enterococcus avium]HBI1561747.1 relaxase/mobilization nuclease domain-containing protein [Enterococcus faecalis]HBI1564795.1 relaxase/mobilization nuclease domain-containing protein [Enterococcus faecalis]HBI1717958.1 relaxase/mobilization nuclease domain-containing protein [Enter